MDEADEANIIIDRITASGIRAVLDSTPTGESGEYCLSCDEEIPPLRRAAVRGVTLCIECQTQLERRR